MLTGLAGCLLPMQTFRLQAQYYHTAAWQNYTGWGVILLLLLFAVHSLLQLRKNKPTHRYVDTLTGAYLTGWALFNAYHTFALFSNAGQQSLAYASQAAAWPREGLLLILATGIWLIAGAIRKA